MTTARGQCLCNAVHFTMEFPSKWVAHCHCTRCQRAHGAAFVTWVSAEQEQVQITDDTQVLRWHVSELGGQRGFCGVCGSSMFFKGGLWPGEIHLSRALFTEPVDKEPQVHAYYNTHVSWIDIQDSLPKKAEPKA